MSQTSVQLSAADPGAAKASKAIWAVARTRVRRCCGELDDPPNLELPLTLGEGLPPPLVLPAPQRRGPADRPRCTGRREKSPTLKFRAQQPINSTSSPFSPGACEFIDSHPQPSRLPDSRAVNLNNLNHVLHLPRFLCSRSPSSHHGA
ncbi:hypothetical protein VTJ04DRAFT_3510 [Mycothermus thermophilus]|uniref:uncharacterized protein n=1 Tax=Humicola insolens TaxID=85995 RepID=UPI003742BF2E